MTANNNGYWPYVFADTASCTLFRAKESQL